MATTALYRTLGTPTLGTKFTLSVWLKRSNPSSGSYEYIMSFDQGNNPRMHIRFNDSTDALTWYTRDGSGTVNEYTTTRLFRDTNSWYHLVFAYDSTQGTASNRQKIYVNGVQETNFTTESYVAQNYVAPLNTNGYLCKISSFGDANYSHQFSGIMYHFHFIDGTAYDASTFGSTDATTGEWKINTSQTMTMGDNGFTILKDGNTITDQSANSNNWTLGGGTLTKTEDCPSNVFATLNPLASLPNTGASTFTNGNTTSQGVNASYVNGGSTLMMSSGKWYAEMKYVATSSASRCIAGITQDVSEISRINQDSGSYNTFYVSSSGNKNIQNTNTSYGATWTTGDIIGIALDLDNNRLFFSKNGAWQNSGDPTSSTGAITGFDAPASTLNGGYFFFSGSDSNAQNNTVSWNFGNGYFGTTQITSAGTNASNIGIFEFDCPAGYTALSTKGLNE